MLPAPVRQKPHQQTPAEEKAVYAYVNARDQGCRARDIDPGAGPCSGLVERHHAGIKVGTKRVTSRDRVVKLCRGHHENWAPSHNRMIVEWLAKLERGE